MLDFSVSLRGRQATLKLWTCGPLGPQEVRAALAPLAGYTFSVCFAAADEPPPAYLGKRRVQGAAET